MSDEEETQLEEGEAEEEQVKFNTFIHCTRCLHVGASCLHRLVLAPCGAELGICFKNIEF